MRSFKEDNDDIYCKRFKKEIPKVGNMSRDKYDSVKTPWKKTTLGRKEQKSH